MERLDQTYANEYKENFLEQSKQTKTLSLQKDKLLFHLLQID